MLLFTAHILRGVFVYIMHENPELHSRAMKSELFTTINCVFAVSVQGFPF